jgi:hypothetical protein
LHSRGKRARGNRENQFDDDYYYWRNEQIDKLDEDYDAWRGERRQKISDEFGKWRTDRASKNVSQTNQESKK